MRFLSHNGRTVRFLSLALCICFLCYPIAIASPVSFASTDTEISPPDILYQEDFEDGDIALADPGLDGGMTWTSHGSTETGSVKSYESRIIMLNAGAYILSQQAVNRQEFTVSSPSSTGTTPMQE